MRRFGKISMLLLMVIGVTFFSACSDDKNEPSRTGDSLSKTEWTRAYGNEVEHLDFISESSVDFYYTKDGAVSSMVGSGTYVKNDNKVIFKDLHITHDFVRMEVMSATINGKNMEVAVKRGGTNGYETTETFRQVK